MQFREIFDKAYTKYRFERSLDLGSCAEVFLAYSGTTPVAIKVLKQIYKDPEEIRQEELDILKEIEIAKKFDHENIIKFISYEKKTWYNLVFEYCEHGDLQRFLNKKFPGDRIPEHQAFKLICQIIAGFRELWSKGVVHRDFKPGNILLGSNYTAKIADFGNSKVIEPNNEAFKTMAGTYFTMAPEVLDRKTYDSKCDIWSLGVIFYRLLTGKEPYDPDCGFSHVFRQRINQMKLGDFLSDTWCFLRELIISMLVIEPKHRISPEQLFERFDAAKKALYEGKYSEDFSMEDFTKSKDWYPATTIKFEEFYYLKTQYLNNWISFEFDREMNGKFLYNDELTSQTGKKGQIHKEPDSATGDKRFEESDNTKTHEKVTHVWPDGVLYSGTLIMNKREGYGELTLPNRTSYKGQWRNNKFHGDGTLSMCDGREYIGKWNSGYPTEGILTLANGSKYEGKWALSLMHDENGTYLFANGAVYRVYTGCFVEGMINDFGEIQYSTGEKYSGFWKNNVICGAGKITWQEGKVFTGRFTPKAASNYDEFIGTFFSDDGVEYQATWRNLRINDAHAIIDWRTGQKYEGTVIRGEIEGEGTMKYPNGEVYTGEWRNGEFHGTGTHFFCDGRKYTGQFLHGKIHGKGTMEYGDGYSYSGEWKDGVANGEGECTLFDGKIFKVNLSEGKQEGPPILLGQKSGFQEIKDTNSIYCGYTKDGKKHGKGKWTFFGGQVIVGDFYDDLLEGYGQITGPSGSYRGMWSKHLYHGQGEFIWPDGSKYVGSFFESSMKGYGERQYASGELYKGEWVNSYRNGYGELVSPDGQKYSGKWLSDQKHGEGILYKTNGEMLIGLWECNKLLNIGTLMYPDGKSYHGEIDVDEILPNGLGTMIYSKEQKVQGVWKKGELVSPAESSKVNKSPI